MKYRRFPLVPIEIDNCYKLFAPRRLKKVNLRALDWEELEDWMQETNVYVGGEGDFRELLPRFFELCWERSSAGETLDFFPLYVISAVSTWPVHEQEAVEGCFLLLWRIVLSNGDAWGVSEILSTLRCAGISWLPFLDEWLSSSASTEVLTWAFHASLLENTPSEVRQWLCQPAVAARIQTDFFAAQTDEDREAISEFEQRLAFYCGR